MKILLGGGKGSGNWQHVGRPGEIGGSKKKIEQDWKILPIYDTLAKKFRSEKLPGSKARTSYFDYLSSGYHFINSSLRKNSVPPEALRLDSLFFSSPRNWTVYRGMNSTFLRNLKVGDEFTDKAFVSTSVEAFKATPFSSSVHRDDGLIEKTLVRIRIPKGQKILFGDREEREIILPRNTRFRVKSELQELTRLTRYPSDGTNPSEHSRYARWLDLEIV